MSILTSLKELFTFTPDPEGKEIDRVANVAVANYALSEKMTHDKRARVCGCGNCRKDAENACDRATWAVDYPITTLRKGQRVEVLYQSGSRGPVGEQDE